MTQAERRLFLIDTLLSERGERIEIPTDEYNQKRLLRSLFNIRMPRLFANPRRVFAGREQAKGYY